MKKQIIRQSVKVDAAAITRNGITIQFPEHTVFLVSQPKPIGSKESKDSYWPHQAFLFQIGDDSFSYKTGIAHRVPHVGKEKDFARAKAISNINWLIQLSDAELPDIEGVIWSIVRDGEATGMSFADWCGDFRYDTDSRKAFVLYEECQNTFSRLRIAWPQMPAKSVLDEYFQDY